MPESRTLEPQQFEDFYGEIWSRQPYRWQTRAAVELAEGRIWAAVSAPTGAGKTTLIECFLFALACTPPEAKRLLPLRLFWVIDRRGVADQVCRHARDVVKAINCSGAGTAAAAVRTRLAEMTGDEHADWVQVRLWRGGLDGEAAEDERAPFSPCTPAIVCTTVDQIGSRMLFRGYGVSNGSRPIEAALTATDSLVVLDEAHLSAPFQETATAICQAQRSVAERCANPLHLMRISATLNDPPKHTFALTEQELSEPALSRRFNASKLVKLKTGRDQVRTCVAEARRLAREGAQVVAVVVNTVSVARSIHTALRNDGETLLLIGPVRPLNRRALHEQTDRVARERRAELQQPLFVVGTQTIEVGLDLDFDALVTACAPLPALAQRFGRLDRAGEMDGAGRGVIVEPPNACFVYGEATERTWKWLSTLAAERPLDLSPAAIDQLRRESSPPDPPARPPAPILGPWHIERMMHTSVSPESDLDVAVFLHGESDVADVQICWRADLDFGRTNPDAAIERAERLRARPPHPGELLSVSPGAARRWLREQQHVDGLSDLESAVEPTTVDDQTRGRWALRIRPPDGDGLMEVEEIQAAALRPGDIIAVPSQYGGCDQFGWYPEARKAVTDLGNLASRQPRILLSGAPNLARQLGMSEDLRLATREIIERVDSEPLNAVEAYDELLPFLIEWLKAGGGFGTDSSLGQTASKLSERIADASDSAATRRRRALPIGARADGEGRSGDLLIVPPTSASRQRSGKPVLYKTHVSEVAARAERFARQIGLSSELVATIALAARNHDAGKLDPRFQAWLNGGAPLNGNSPLAKSEFDPRERRSDEARQTARWPKGKRHESISASLLADVKQWPGKAIPELLIHLVHTHHGDGRPFRKAPDDPDPGATVVAPIAIDPGGQHYIEQTVESDAEIPWPEHIERYIALNHRYGLWGLAALETILVLADRSVSAEEGR